MKEFNSGDDLAESAAKDLAVSVLDLLNRQEKVQLVLTGGTVGIKTLAALADHLKSKDLSRLHLWWGDERFVEKASSDRNFIQAEKALLSKIDIPTDNIHQMPALDSVGLEQAAEQFRAHIEAEQPEFDIVLLGMGPDAHVASLFPGSKGTKHGDLVISEPQSPKPPSRRISLSYDALSSAGQVWFLVSSADKADAVYKVFSGADLPATKVSGKKLTRWYIDQAAAAKLTS